MVLLKQRSLILSMRVDKALCSLPPQQRLNRSGGNCTHGLLPYTQVYYLLYHRPMMTMGGFAPPTSGLTPEKRPALCLLSYKILKDTDRNCTCDLRSTALKWPPLGALSPELPHHVSALTGLEPALPLP